MKKDNKEDPNYQQKISTEETVDELRYRLDAMKRMMAERQMGGGGGDVDDTFMDSRSRRQASNIIDGNFLSIVFGVALVVIITVSIYAFYNLYNAILKKFPTDHTEL